MAHAQSGFTHERRLDWEELDAFLASAEGACFYHGSTWLRGLAAVYSLELGWLTHREDGRLVGLLPFAESRRFGIAHRQSLPFGTYGGPALVPGADPALGSALCAAFLASAGGRRQRVSLILPPDSALPAPPTAGMPLATQILDLSPGWDELFAKHFRKEKRRQARKALREGVVVARSLDPADVADYYPIYLDHARSWSLATPTPLAHLQQLVGDEERVRFWVARHRGVLIGAHFNFHFRGEVIAWHGTTSTAHRQLAPSVFLYACNLEDACAGGERTFNFGGSGAKDPLFEYKAAFGAQPVHYALLRRDGRLLGALQSWRGRRAGGEAVA